MKRLRKVLCMAMALAVITASFSGCGKKASDKDEQGRTIVSVGEWPTKEGVLLDNRNELKTQFEKANPDVAIVPDEWSYDIQTFYPKATAGKLPTVYKVYFTEVSKVIDGGYSADLTGILKEKGYMDYLNPKVLEVISKDGKVYGIPFATYILGLGCNIELFEKAGLMEADGTPKQPKDWYELADFAVKIKNATGKPGFVLPTSSNNGGWIFTPIAWSFGVKFMEQDSNGKWQATFDSDEMREAVQFVKDLKWKYNVLPDNNLIDNSEYYKQFAIGNAGMIIAADLGSKGYQYDMSPDKIGMMALPKGPKRHVSLLGGGMYCIANNATKDQIDAAFRWIEADGNSMYVQDGQRERSEKLYQDKVSRGEMVGTRSLSRWTSEAETEKLNDEIVKKYTNVNPNHYKLYNEFLSSDVEIQAEEPVCAQDLYGVLDNIIQEVLQNKDADVAKLVKDANNDFQQNFLNLITY